MTLGIGPVKEFIPPDMPRRATVRGVTWKNMADREIEARIRAYLREYQAERQIGQVELAERLGVTQGAISRILSGNRGVGLGLALRVSRLLRVSMPRLLEENPPEKFWDHGTYPKTRT